METVGINPGAFVVSATNSEHQDPQYTPVDEVTSNLLTLATPSRSTYNQIQPDASAWLDTPANVANHFEASNVRGSVDQDPTPGEDAWTHRNNLRLSEDISAMSMTMPYQTVASEPQTPSNAASFGVEKSSAAETMEPGQLTRAYAMIKFRDSHCYITTPNLVIVRDNHFLQDWQAHEKERKRRAKAQEALQQYALEPSQPSQPGDDDRHESSRSGDSLVGRPEHCLLSHYSEQGGPVAYALSKEEEEIRSTQRKRRLLRTLQNSSSANSVAPHNLHPNEGSEFLQTGQHFDSDGHPSDPLEWAQLPVHPPRPEDIKKISREHLIFSYNSDIERWELKIIGNRAFVNDTLYDKHKVVTLSHNDEIIIASLTMNFMLPDDLIKENDSDGAQDDGVDSVEAESPESWEDTMVNSDDETKEVAGASPKRSRPKIKLTFKKDRSKNGAKSGGKGKGKSNAEEKPSTTSESPEAAKKSTKARKPSDAVEGAKRESPVPSAAPHNFEPNSALAALPPESLPEKRKGPGRPPKNGLVSKRDEAIVRKKMKEYEKKGLPVPDYRILLEETRNENRQRDLANKAQARGEPPPETPIPSIENPRNSEPASQPTAENMVQSAGSQIVPERKPSPKPRRVVRTPSPMRPESSYTEEELKKPNMTYIYIIDEVLQNVEGGHADLQTIYDKIQKRWPFYHYKVNSQGWQSSVRHNLLSCNRFLEAGKSGKGKFWTINYEHQLDKQKRKPSPPATARAPAHNIPNGQFASNGQGIPSQWYGQPQYTGPYGPPNANGHAQPSNPGPVPGSGTYYSPYAPSHSAGQHPSGPVTQGPTTQTRQPSGNGVHVRSSTHTPNQISQRPPMAQVAQMQSQPHQPSPPFQPVVNAIMNYRTEYLGRYVPGSEEYLKHEERFKKGTQYFSNLFHQQGNDEIRGEDFSKEPFSRIEQIFEHYRNLFSAPQNNATASATDSHGQTVSDSLQVDGTSQPTASSTAVAASIHPMTNNGQQGNPYPPNSTMPAASTTAITTAAETKPISPMLAASLSVPATGPAANPAPASPNPIPPGDPEARLGQTANEEKPSIGEDTAVPSTGQKRKLDESDVDNADVKRVKVD